MSTHWPPIRCCSRLTASWLIPAISALSACSTAAPEHTGFQESLGVTVTSREIRIRTSDYALLFSQTVELTADSILTLATDRSVARNALIWKTYAVPAIYRAATLPDPLMAWIDSRVLTHQMSAYFSNGRGRALFGDHQHLALEAVRFLESELNKAVELSGQEVDQELRDGITGFAAENPLNNPYFFRRSPVEVLAKSLGRDHVTGLQAVGSLTEMLEDMSQRLNVYSELLPRAGRWQVELLLAELADPGRAAIYLDVLNQLEAMETLNQFLQDTPDMMDEQRRSFELALERYVTDAKEDILASATIEREEALRDFERIIGAEIGGAVTRLDGSISRAVVNIDEALGRAVDQLFVRLLQLVAIVLAAAFLLVFLLRRRLVPAQAE